MSITMSTITTTITSSCSSSKRITSSPYRTSTGEFSGSLLRRRPAGFQWRSMAVAASKYPEILWRRSGSTIERNPSTTTQHNNHMTIHSNNNHNINTNNSSSASCFLTKSYHTQAPQQQSGFLPFCSTKQKPVSPQLFLSILLHIDSSSSYSWKQEFSNKKCPPALAFRD